MGGNPDGAQWWHYPYSIICCHGHDATGGVQQLRSGMAVEWRNVPGRKFSGHDYDWTGDCHDLCDLITIIRICLVCVIICLHIARNIFAFCSMVNRILQKHCCVGV